VPHETLVSSNATFGFDTATATTDVFSLAAVAARRELLPPSLPFGNNMKFVCILVKFSLYELELNIRFTFGP